MPFRVWREWFVYCWFWVWCQNCLIHAIITYDMVTRVITLDFKYKQQMLFILDGWHEKCITHLYNPYSPGGEGIGNHMSLTRRQIPLKVDSKCHIIKGCFDNTGMYLTDIIFHNNYYLHMCLRIQTWPDIRQCHSCIIILFLQRISKQGMTTCNINTIPAENTKWLFRMLAVFCKTFHVHWLDSRRFAFILWHSYIPTVFKQYSWSGSEYIHVSKYWVIQADW